MAKVLFLRGRFSKTISGVFVFFVLLYVTPSQASQPHFYILPEPLETSLEMSWYSKLTHSLIQPLWFGLKTYVWWQVPSVTLIGGMQVGGPEFVILSLPTSFLKIWGYTTAYSRTHLNILSSQRDKNSVRALVENPEVRRVLLFNGYEVGFTGFVSSELKSRALVVIESEGPLTLEKIPQEFGVPLSIPSLSEVRFNIQLLSRGNQVGEVWSPTLETLLQRKAVEKELFQSWRKEIIRLSKGDTWWDWVKNRTTKDNLSLEISVETSSNKKDYLGNLLQRKSAKKFLGFNFLKKVRSKLGFSISEPALPLYERKAKKTRTCIEELRK